MEYIIQTERLYLRKMTYDDLDALKLILMDSEVMYAYEHAFSEQETLEWLNRQLSRYIEYGNYGLWAVILKDNNQMIGQCGLTMQPYNDSFIMEIGYLFQKAYWHKGYATEAAIACKNYAFNTLNQKEVYSIIRDTNVASQNVALRNGMTAVATFIKRYYNIDMPHIVYKVSNVR